MIAVAPAWAASAANAIDPAGLVADTPTITGTRPAAARATAPTTARRSAASRLPDSPIVPFATRPWTPASRYAATLRSSARSSTSPSASNGVVTAGMMPSKCMAPIMPPRTVRVRPAPRAQWVHLGRRVAGIAVRAPRRLGRPALERLEAARQRADRVGDRVGQVDPVGVRALGLAAVDAHDMAGVADHGRVRRDVGDHDAVGA